MRLVFLSFIVLSLFFQAVLYSQTPGDTNSAKTYLSIGLKGNYYTSWPNSPGGIPLKLTNPILSGKMGTVSFGYNIVYPNVTHEFTLDFVFPSKLKLDDGLGNNFILKEIGSTYFFGELNYHFSKTLFLIGKLNLQWGAALNLLYEESKLEYLHGAELKRWDITNHIGLFLGADYKLFNPLLIYTKIRPFFTLGILNTGNQSYSYAENNISESFSYHASGIYSIFQLGIKYDLNSNSAVEAGYYRKGNINIATREIFRSDYQNSFNRINRNEGFYLIYYLNTWLLW